jgi:hypothetical protein
MIFMTDSQDKPSIKGTAALVPLSRWMGLPADTLYIWVKSKQARPDSHLTDDFFRRSTLHDICTLATFLDTLDHARTFFNLFS